MVMQIRSDIMIDLEFLSRQPDASVIQIAAITFGPGCTPSSFNSYINEINGSVGMPTLQWWMKQVKDGSRVFDQIESHGCGTLDALTRFSRWIKIQDYDHIWCKGSLDFPILTTKYANIAESDVPWKWWKEHEVRTVLHVAEVANPNGGHDALDDCHVQAKALMGALEYLR